MNPRGIVCTMCRARDCGPWGVYVASGFVFCPPCARLVAKAIRIAERAARKAQGAV